MATIVFTDLVGSTALRSSLGEDRADALRRAHDHLLSERVVAHGGRVVKGGGDGLLAAFESASEALAATVAMQQAIASYNRRSDRIAELSVRVGLSVGDVLWEDSDCFGTPVVEAARLEAAANGGQILCSDLVRLMARGRGGHEFVAIGELDLKGLPEPVSAYEVLWAEAPGATIVPMPAALTVATSDPFVGRADELAALRGVVAELGRAAPTVAWLAGEPGIGKSRLAAELASQLRAGGWTVLFGRCDESLAAPYQPFAEALRHVVAHTEDAELADLLGETGASELAHLCPDLAHRLLSSPTGGGQDQYRLFEAVRAWLAAAALRNPVLLVVDDAHWATQPTLLLLNYLARTLTDGRVGFVVTVRDTECPDELRSIMDESALRPGGLQLRLGGLGPAEVAELAGGDGAQLHAQTAGNPLFVRAVMATGDAGTTLDAAIRRRVARLGAAIQDTLRLAALAGLEFDAKVVAHATGLAIVPLLDQLDDAVLAGLVQDVGANGFRFAHGLVRDALVEQVRPARRLLGNRALAEAYEALRPYDVAALARHWSEAADDPDSVARAVAALERAGDAAEAASDHDSAARAYARAIELLGDVQTETRAGLAYALGLSRMNGGSYAEETERLFLDAVVRAERLGLDELRVEAAFHAGNVRGFFGGASLPALNAIQRLAANPPADSQLAARSLAVLAALFPWMGERAEAVRVARQALTDAEAAGDSWAICWAQIALSTSLPYSQARESAVHSLAGVDKVHSSGTDALGGSRRSHVVKFFLTTGDLDGADAHLGALALEADRRRDPFLQNVAANARSTLSVLRGDFAGAENATNRAEVLSAALEGVDVSGVGGTQMFSIRREQGRLAEIAPAMRVVARLNPEGAWRPGLAAIYAELGMLAEARAEIDRLIVAGHIDIPVDSREAISASYLADAVAAVGDAANAAVLYDHMRPWTGLNVVAFVIACYGPVDRYLGMLALTMGSLDLAEGHLRDAVDQCQSMISPTYEAHCRYWLARVADARGDRTGREREAAAALDLATRLGMAGLVARIEALSATARR